MGAAVELLVAASLFGVPVYTFIPNGNIYHWLCYEPLKSDELVCPKDPLPLRLYNIDHIELLNVHGCHYDSIALSDGGVNMLDRPPLRKNIEFVAID